MRRTIALFLFFLIMFATYASSDSFGAECDTNADPWCHEVGTGNYGCVLDQYRGVDAISNGGFAGGSCGKYQCVEYMKRFYSQRFGISIGSIGVAQNIYSMASQFGLHAYPNGENTAPRPDDILVFGNSNGIGHVAIVIQVNQDSVSIIEQNWSSSNCTTSLPVVTTNGNYQVPDRGDYYVIGWVSAYQRSTNNLVAYYPFDGNAKDASGNGNDGQVHNATFKEGKIGHGLEFTGNDDSYVEVSNSSLLNPEHQVTVAMWAKVYNYSAWHACLIYKAGEQPTSDGFKDRCYSLWATGVNGVHFTSTPDGGTSQIQCNTGGGLYDPDVFTHFVGIVDTYSHSMSIYVNGSLIETCPFNAGKVRGGNYPLPLVSG